MSDFGSSSTQLHLVPSHPSTHTHTHTFLYTTLMLSSSRCRLCYDYPLYFTTLMETISPLHISSSIVISCLFFLVFLYVFALPSHYNSFYIMPLRFSYPNPRTNAIYYFSPSTSHESSRFTRSLCPSFHTCLSYVVHE